MKAIEHRNLVIVDFLPAAFTDGKECYVSYYVKNPENGILKRLRHKLNRVRSRMTASEFKKYHIKFCHDINIRLTEGWNPLVEQNAPKSFIRLNDALNTWLTSKTRESRKNSIRSYKSHVEILQEYIDTVIKNPNIYVINFDRKAASTYMQWLWTEKTITPRTYNNKRNMYLTIWNWLKEFNYSNDNVFEPIRKRKAQEKNRDFLPLEVRNKIREYLEQKNPQFLVCCLMAFHCLLRPGEITGIKKKNVRVDQQAIWVEPEVAKNGHGRWAMIPDSMMQYLKYLDLDGNQDDYIFSSKLFKSGKIKMDPRIISKYWVQIRTKLNLTMREKFYSLRDTGIIQMLQDGVSPETIRQLADHSSLAMTGIYTKHINPEANQIMKTKSSGF